MSIRGDIAIALMAASLLVIALSVLGALVLSSIYAKLHYLTPVSSVAVPMFVAGLVVQTGWGITAGLEILTGALLMVSGPMLQIAIGRVQAEHDGVLTPQSPQ